VNKPEPTCRAALRSPVFWLLAGLMLLTAQSAGAGVQISPTRIQLDANSRVEALTLRNTTNRDKSFQIELSGWSQVDGQDHYQSTTDLLVTPPIFTVPSGEQQIIRIGLRRPPSRDTELSYRVFIQELPQPAPENFTGLQMVLRLGIPIFVAPASADSTHQLTWQATLDETGRMHLLIANLGNGHARISNLSLSAGSESIEAGGMFYVLPGATRKRELATTESFATGTDVDLSASINRVPLTIRLRVE
jgi:fimbrial chaperone protein